MAPEPKSCAGWHGPEVQAEAWLVARSRRAGARVVPNLLMLGLTLPASLTHNPGPAMFACCLLPGFVLYALVEQATHAASLLRTRPKNPTAAAARWAIGPLLPLATVAVVVGFFLSEGLDRGGPGKALLVLGLTLLPLARAAIHAIEFSEAPREMRRTRSPLHAAAAGLLLGHAALAFVPILWLVAGSPRFDFGPLWMPALFFQLSLIGWWAVLVFPWKRGFRVRRRWRLLPTLSLARPLVYAAVFGFLGLLLTLVLAVLFWSFVLQRLNA